MAICVPRLTLLEYRCRFNADVERALGLTKCASDEDVCSFTALIALAALRNLHHVAVADYIRRADPKNATLYELVASLKVAAEELFGDGGGVMTAGEAARALGVAVPPKWPEGRRAEPLLVAVPVWHLFRLGVPPWQYYVARGYAFLTRRTAAEVFKRMLFAVADSVASVVRSMEELYRQKLPDVELPYRPKPAQRRREGGGRAPPPEADPRMPPCIERLIEDLQRGENLPHFARFALATFLTHAGWSVDQIVDLFRNAPDFDEKVTRYQVEHVAGKRGGGKRYAPPACARMRQEGLCVADCGVGHPLVFLRRGPRQGNSEQSS